VLDSASFLRGLLALQSVPDDLQHRKDLELAEFLRQWQVRRQLELGLPEVVRSELAEGPRVLEDRRVGPRQGAVQALLGAPHAARQFQGGAELFQVPEDLVVGIVVPYRFDVLIKKQQGQAVVVLFVRFFAVLVVVFGGRVFFRAVLRAAAAAAADVLC